MKLYLSGFISDDIILFLKEQLPIDSEPKIISHKSQIDSTSMQIIGDILQWHYILKASIAAFFIELSREAAKDLYKNKENIAKALKNKTVEALKKIAELFCFIKSKMPDNFLLNIGIPISNEYFCAKINISSDEIEDVSWQLAIFIDKIIYISEFLEEIENTDLKPLTITNINITDNGKAVLEWMDIKNMKIHEKIF